MKTFKTLAFFLSLYAPLLCMRKEQAEPLVALNKIENYSNKAVTIIGSRGERTWDIGPASIDKPASQSLTLWLSPTKRDLTIISQLGQIRLELEGNTLKVITGKGSAPLSAALYKNSKIVVRTNGFIELVPQQLPTETAIQPLPAIRPPVSQASGTPAVKPAIGISKEYKSLAQFILDDNPRQPSQIEAGIVQDYENIYLDTQNWVDTFWIEYDDLRNVDGSKLTPAQKNAVIAYFKRYSKHATDTGFRFANNNVEVLGGPAGQNPVWKLMHTYLRRLTCLVDRLKNLGSGPCPSNKAQLAKNPGA